MPKRLKLLLINSSGDTIVEVLIAIAVVSLVLGAAFTSSNKSLQTTQRSQERNEALKMVESQLELLNVARANGSLSESRSTDFCITDDLQVRDASENVCKKGPDGRYALQTVRTGETPLTYQASARWEPLGSGEVQVVTLTYRSR